MICKNYNFNDDYRRPKSLEEEGLLSGEGTAPLRTYRLTMEGFIGILSRPNSFSANVLPSRLAIDLETEDGFRRFFLEAKAVRELLPDIVEKFDLISKVRWKMSGVLPPLLTGMKEFAEGVVRMGHRGSDDDTEIVLFLHLARKIIIYDRGNPGTAHPFAADPVFNRHINKALEDYKDVEDAWLARLRARVS